MSAKKLDDGKARWDLVPMDAVDDAAQVFAFGAAKYGDRNWESGLAWGRLLAALLRHLAAWSMGQDTDAESGRPHLAHATCCMLMLAASAKRGIGADDRGGR